MFREEADSTPPSDMSLRFNCFASRDDADPDVCVRGSEDVRNFIRPRDEEMGGDQ